MNIEKKTYKIIDFIIYVKKHNKKRQYIDKCKVVFDYLYTRFESGSIFDDMECFFIGMEFKDFLKVWYNKKETIINLHRQLVKGRWL